jgi:hypothetical protein
MRTSAFILAFALSLINSMAFAFEWPESTSVPSSYTGPPAGWPVPYVTLVKPDASKAALTNAYRVYAIVKYCNSTRQGYLVTYVNDVELDRARDKIKLIEAPYIAENKNLDTSGLFGEAVKSVGSFVINQQICHFALSQLLSDWKTPGGNPMIKKDF